MASVTSETRVHHVPLTPWIDLALAILSTLLARQGVTSQSGLALLSLRGVPRRLRVDGFPFWYRGLRGASQTHAEKPARRRVQQWWVWWWLCRSVYGRCKRARRAGAIFVGQCCGREAGATRVCAHHACTHVATNVAGISLGVDCWHEYCNGC